MAGGDGRSHEHAFVVISVAKESEMLAALRWHRSGSQALITGKDHSYDTIEGEDGNGKKATFWFQIDRVLAAEARMIYPSGAAPPR